MNDPGTYKVGFGEFQKDLQDAMSSISDKDKVQINDVCKSYIAQLLNRIETAHTHREKLLIAAKNKEEKENQLRDIVCSQVTFATRIAIQEQMRRLEKRIVQLMMHTLMGQAIDDEYDKTLEYNEDEDEGED